MRARVSVACALVALSCGGAQKATPPRALAPPHASTTCEVSAATTRVLGALEHPLVIEAYLSRDTPELDALSTHVEKLLRAFSRANDHVVVRTIDAQTPEARALADAAGLKPFVDEGKSTQHYSGLVFSHGVERDTIPMLSPQTDAGLEFWIANKIRQLHDKVDHVSHRIGLLVGHDELRLGEANLVPESVGKPSMREVIVRNFPYFEFVGVDLKSGQSPVDDTLEGLLVTQPAADITEAELRRIDEFVIKGRALVVFASAVNVAAGDAAMHATLDTRNLGTLLDGYGIEMHKDVVLDFGRSFKVTVAAQSGVESARFPALLEIDDDERFTGNERLIDTTFAPFFRMEQIVVPFASSLTLHRERQPSASMKVVARSTPHSVHVTHDTDLGLRAWRPQGAWAQFDIAAYVEGRMKSAFTSDVVPSGATARVFVLASSQLTANPFARAGNPSPSSPTGDGVLLQIAGPYADLQRGAVPLLYSIMVTVNALDAIVDGAALSATTTLRTCEK